MEFTTFYLQNSLNITAKLDPTNRNHGLHFTMPLNRNLDTTPPIVVHHRYIADVVHTMYAALCYAPYKGEEWQDYISRAKEEAGLKRYLLQADIANDFAMKQKLIGEIVEEA